MELNQMKSISVRDLLDGNVKGATILSHWVVWIKWNDFTISLNDCDELFIVNADGDELFEQLEQAISLEYFDFESADVLLVREQFDELHPCNYGYALRDGVLWVLDINENAPQAWPLAAM
jgi:hypothetical protein